MSQFDKPDHQHFVAGDYSIWSHDYDGDVLHIIFKEKDPTKPGAWKGFAIEESELVKKLEELRANKSIHIPPLEP